LITKGQIQVSIRLKPEVG